MTAVTRSTWIALTALLLCSACADKPTTTTLITPTAQQFSALQWDEATAAVTAAHVNNNSLIMMR